MPDNLTSLPPTAKTSFSPRLLSGSKLLILALILLPILVLIFLVDRLAVDVPYYDQWNWVGFFQAAENKTLTFNDLWWQHNEHRLFFLKLLTLGLAAFGGWNILREIYVSIFFVVLSLPLFWHLLKQTVSQKYALPLTVPISFLLFSTVHWFNWMWGFQMAWFLVDLLIILAVWLLATFPARWYTFLGAVLATVVACYTMSNALPYWIAGLIPLTFARRWPRYYTLLWLLSGALCLFFFYYNLTSLSSWSDYSFVLKEPLVGIFYILAFMGGPILPVFGWAGAALTGLLGLFLFSLAGYRLFKLNRKNKELFLFEKSLPWLQLGFFALGNAILSCIARGSFGVASALTPRYVTVPALFWISTGALLFLFGTTLYQKSSVTQTRRFLVISGFALAGLLTLAYFFSYFVSYGVMAEWTEAEQRAAMFVLDYKNAPDEGMDFVHPKTELIREKAVFLEAHGHTPFSATAKNRLLRTQEAWFSQVSNPQQLTYRFSSADVISTGDLLKIATTPTDFSLQLSGTPTATFTLDLRGKDGQYLSVSADAAVYLTVYVDGVQESQKIVVPSLFLLGKKNLFVTHLSPKPVTLRLELVYPAALSQAVPVQVALYK